MRQRWKTFSRAIEVSLSIVNRGLSLIVFVGSQYRLIVEGNDYYIGLLLYHRTLKSLIAVELKIGEFQHEHKGKMEFYLVALNEQMMLRGRYQKGSNFVLA